jgi:hypothetical protein
MNNFPHQISQHEPTKKQLWLAAFTSLLARLPPDEAVKQADLALELCDERWKEPQWVWSWEYKHSHPVGFEFRHDPSLPLTNEAPRPTEPPLPG